MENETAKVHSLKTVQPYFDLVKARKKRFEVRKNDRDFKKGDFLILQEYNPDTKQFTSKQVIVKVDSIFQEDLKYALKQDYCIMSIKFKEDFNEEDNVEIESVIEKFF